MHQDYWSHEGYLWVRHHVKPRSRLFVPLNQLGGPPIDRLKPTRKTRVRPICEDPSTSIDPYYIEDVWNTGDIFKDEKDLTQGGNPQWLGATQFQEIDQVEEGVVLDVGPGSTESAQQAKGLRVPNLPTDN